VVTWNPTWEPEEMTIHADFEQKVQEYLMNKDPGPISLLLQQKPA